MREVKSIGRLFAARQGDVDRTAEFENRKHGAGILAASRDDDAGRGIGHAARHDLRLLRTGLEVALRDARRFDLQQHDVARKVRVGKQSGRRAEAADDILFLVGLRADHVAAGLGRDDPLAEEQLQIALLQTVDLLQRGLQALAEDVLARFE